MNPMRITPIIFIISALQILSSQSVADYKKEADAIIEASLKDSSTYERLAELCDTFGPRFSGSQNLEDAIDWILEEMKQDGLYNVHGEEVTVPHWVRGKEAAELIEPHRKNLNMLGLGGSIATPRTGIRAEVLVVKNFDELEARKEEAKGKIVLFNAPFTTYGETVQYRYRGAPAAAKAGAVASLIRSVGPYSMDTPHTGVMAYEENVRKIPHAAITVEDAMMLQRIQDRGQKIVVKLQMSAKMLPDAISRNVVAEIRGSEKPEEVVVIGGHIDSWDVGQGAMDDAGGCVVAWDALNVINNLGLKPKRTIRCVMWTNEENGLGGAKAYRDAHMNELDNHVLAVESDAGVFAPKGFGFSGSPEGLKIIREIGKLLEPIGAGEIRDGGGGADIGPMKPYGVPLAGLNVDGSRYFWYHHTHADMMDKLNPDEVNRCKAAMAVLAYVVADMPQKLPRVIPE